MVVAILVVASLALGLYCVWRAMQIAPSVGETGGLYLTAGGWLIIFSCALSGARLWMLI